MSNLEICENIDLGDPIDEYQKSDFDSSTYSKHQDVNCIMKKDKKPETNTLVRLQMEADQEIEMKA